jgi:hypothetical protein
MPDTNATNTHSEYVILIAVTLSRTLNVFNVNGVRSLPVAY